MEARIARREDARARDTSPDVAHLPGGGDAMGLGGDDSFAAAKQRCAALVVMPRLFLVSTCKVLICRYGTNVCRYGTSGQRCTTTELGEPWPNPRILLMLCSL